MILTKCQFVMCSGSRESLSNPERAIILKSSQHLVLYFLHGYLLPSVGKPTSVFFFICKIQLNPALEPSTLIDKITREALIFGHLND